MTEQEPDILSELTSQDVPDKQVSDPQEREEIEQWVQSKSDPVESAEATATAVPDPQGQKPAEYNEDAHTNPQRTPEGLDVGSIVETASESMSEVGDSVVGAVDTAREEVVGFGDALLFGEYGLFGKLRRANEMPGGKVVGPILRGMARGAGSLYNLGVELNAVQAAFLPEGVQDWIMSNRIDLDKQLHTDDPVDWGSVTIPLSAINSDWPDIPLPVADTSEFASQFIVPFTAVRGATVGRGLYSGSARQGWGWTHRVGKEVVGDIGAGGITAFAFMSPEQGNITTGLKEAGFDSAWIRNMDSKAWAEEGRESGNPVHYLMGRLVNVPEEALMGPLGVGFGEGIGAGGRLLARNMHKTPGWIHSAVQYATKNGSKSAAKDIEIAGNIMAMRMQEADRLFKEGVPLGEIPTRLDEAGFSMDEIGEHIIPAMGIVLAKEFNITDPRVAEDVARALIAGDGDLGLLFVGGDAPLQARVDQTVETIVNQGAKDAEGQGILFELKPVEPDAYSVNVDGADVPVNEVGSNLLRQDPASGRARIAKRTAEREKAGEPAESPLKTVAREIQENQERTTGVLDPTDHSEQAIETLSGRLLAEILYEMDPKRIDASAIGWYTKNFEEAVETLTPTFPDLVKPRDRGMFTLFTALSSDGAAVELNTRMGSDLYAQWKSTGKIPQGIRKSIAANANESLSGGWRQSVGINLNKIRSLEEQLGGIDEVLDFMNTEFTVTELKKLSRDLGITDKLPDLGYPVKYRGEEVRIPGSIILGGKLGSFHANLSGKSGMLTSDRWFNRTVNRHRGQLLKSPTAVGMERFRAIIGATDDMPERELLNRATELARSYANKGFKHPEFDDHVLAAGKALKILDEGASKPKKPGNWGKKKLDEIRDAIRKKVSEIDARDAKRGGPPPRIRGDREMYKELLTMFQEKQANGLYKTLTELNDSPAGSMDRAFQWEVMRRVAEKASKETGREVKVSDVQAGLWYYEKRLVSELGGKGQVRDIGYAEASELLYTGDSHANFRSTLEQDGFSFKRNTKPERVDGSGDVHGGHAADDAGDGGAVQAETGQGQRIVHQDDRGIGLLDLETGAAFIRGLKGADASTAQHEGGHALLAQHIARGADSDILDDLTKQFAEPDGEWSDRAMHNFAKAWEQYFANEAGLPPEIRGTFSRIAAELRDVYRDAENSPLAKHMGPGAKEVLGRLTARTDLPIRLDDGSYMPAVNWDDTVEHIRIGIEDGRDWRDMIQEGDFLATARMADTGNVRPGFDPKNQNPFRQGDNRDALRIVAAYEDLARRLQGEGLVKPLSMDETANEAIRHLATRTGMGHDELAEEVARLMRVDQNKPGEAARHVLTMTMLMESYANHIVQLRNAAAEAGGIVAKAKLQRAFIEYQFIAAHAKVKKRSAGQELRAWGYPGWLPDENALNDIANAEKFMARMGRTSESAEELIDSLTGVTTNPDDAKLLVDTVLHHNRNMKASLPRRVAEEMAVNGMLSRLSTFAGLAVGSPMLQIGIEGLGKMAASSVHLFGKVDGPRQFGQVMRNLRNNWNNVTISLRMAFKTYLAEQPQLMHGRDLIDPAWDRRAVKIDPEKARSRWNWADTDPGQMGLWVFNNVVGGHLVRFPQRAIMTIDEFFRQMTGRTALMDKIYNETMDRQIESLMREGKIPQDANRTTLAAERKKLHEAVTEATNVEVETIIKDGHLQNELGLTKEAMQDPEIRAIEDPIERGRAAADWVVKQQNETSDVTGMKRSEAVAHVEEYAPRATFQSDLGPNATRFQDFFMNLPYGTGRILGNWFYRTPMNLMYRAFGMSPTTGVAEVWSRSASFLGGRRNQVRRLEEYEHRMINKHGQDFDKPGQGDPVLTPSGEHSLGRDGKWRYEKIHKMTPGERAQLTRLRNNANLPRRATIQPESELGFLHQRHLADIESGDPRRVIEARGRQATGLAIIGTVWLAYENEMLFGRLPENKHKRELMKSAGYIENSLRFGDTQFGFNKVDPFAFITSLTLDAFTLFEERPDLTEEEQNDVITALIYASTQNIKNKPYVQTAAGLMDAMNDPERADRYLRGVGKAFIPWSGMQQQIIQSQDPVIRDVTQLIDDLRANTAVSGVAPPNYNIMGEEITRVDEGFFGNLMNIASPIKIQTISDDPVLKELVRLDYGFSEPRSTWDGIDLRMVEGPEGFGDNEDPWSAYHYWQHALKFVTQPVTMPDGSEKSLTMREMLDSHVKPGGAFHAMYKEMGEEISPVSRMSPKIERLDGIIKTWQVAAKHRMIEECGELRSALYRVDLDRYQTAKQNTDPSDTESHAEMDRQIKAIRELLGEPSP